MLTFVRPSDMMLMLMLQPLGIEETKGLIIPLFFLVSINLLFNNWAKDQVRATNALTSCHPVLGGWYGCLVWQLSCEPSRRQTHPVRCVGYCRF